MSKVFSAITKSDSIFNCELKVSPLYYILCPEDVISLIILTSKYMKFNSLMSVFNLFFIHI